MQHAFSAPRGKAGRGHGVTAVLGPTNTGKTHLAIERMLAHQVGIIGLPLRLLAREVYDKVVARVGASQVALITGEEKIKPASARYYVCTVEAMPLDIEADFVAVDEIQLAADEERGHVFTDRLFNARGLEETLLLGAATMRPAIQELLPAANLVSRPRLSKLSYAADKKITRLPRRSAIVAFSANEVYAIAELVRRQRGGAAVVLGALSPRTRNAQVALYQNGDVDFLVATDAIGMGLNLHLDHVAFAGIRKFDGLSHRDLRSSELGQIAGRAGRYMNDGTFGVTGQVTPFDPDLVNALEEHHFDPVTTLKWRNRKLDLGSIEALKESLRVTPDHPRLCRARMVDDVIALENVSLEAKIRDMAKGPAAIGLLWEMCQIPDYRKISAANHAELITTLYGFMMSDAARISSDWFAEQIERSERTDGDIDTLSSRLAQIRTWTFVSHRGRWLDDAEYWQGRTREIEDSLSDALHERLALRFVDRRTSVLMRRLRDKEELVGEVGADGQILVENHYVGQLHGFNFTPDASGEGIRDKAARHAASSVVTQELTARAGALAAAPDEAITLSPTGQVLWQGAEIARVEAGETALKPRLRIIASEHLHTADRERIASRLEAWLDAHLKARIGPLIELANATDLTGLARGFAFRLTENLGVLRRDSLAEEIKALDQPARRQLRRYGVRFGAFNIYIPALLKPDAAELLLLLWALHDGSRYGIELDSMPPRPQHGLTSVEADPAIPAAFWQAAGFFVAGHRAVRIDMLERLSDLIRQRISWRPVKAEAEAKTESDATVEAETAAPDEPASPEPAKETENAASPESEPAQTEGAASEAPAEIAREAANPEVAPQAPTPAPEADAKPETAASPEGQAPTAELQPKAETAPKADTQPPAPPSGATGDGGFRIVPELMSVVGCSGEDLASVLQALGFRRTRRPLPPETGETAKQQDSAEQQTEAATEPAPSEALQDRAQDQADGAAAPAELNEPATKSPVKSTAKSAAKSASEEPAEPRYDEIWRPARHGANQHRARHRPQDRARGKYQGKPHAKRQGDGQAQAKSGRDQTAQKRSQKPRHAASAAKQDGKPWAQGGKSHGSKGHDGKGHGGRDQAGKARSNGRGERATASPNSPFAALEELRQAMLARSKEGR